MGVHATRSWGGWCHSEERAREAERGETGAHNCSRGACRELSDAPDDARLSRGPADGVAARGGVLGTDGVRSAECGCGG